VLALDEEAPYPVKGFDLIVSLGTLDTVNDLPGALIHLRHALAPGGLALISMMAAGSLPVLRSIMLEADGERPAARLHPAVDVRSGAQLLQRVGLANPVADARGLDVRFGSLGALVSDLRAQDWAPCWPMPRRLWARRRWRVLRPLLRRPPTRRAA
jgi:SAM-dependent methyltransferase